MFFYFHEEKLLPFSSDQVPFSEAHRVHHVAFHISKNMNVIVQLFSTDDLILMLCDHKLSEMFKVDSINVSCCQMACVEITSERFDSLNCLVLQVIDDAGHVEAIYS